MERPAARSRRRLALRRPRPAPPHFWRRLTPLYGFSSYAQRRDWLLVLNARDIPFCLCQLGRREHVYVPPIMEQIARSELRAFSAENMAAPHVRESLPLHRHWQLASLYILPAVMWYGLERHWWATPPFLPDPAALQAAGSLSGIQLFIYGQWWRTATAIWLHNGIAHLTGNVFFGALFLCMLARICGVGRAWLLACLGAIAGNAISACLHPLAYASIGFSTVVFAALGAAAGTLLSHYAEKFFMPVAAAAAILAMVGTEGANTDYSAHVCSLCCGLALGMLAELARKKNWPRLPQWLAGTIAITLPLAGWALAITKP